MCYPSQSYGNYLADMLLIEVKKAEQENNIL